jgi:arylsulfatase A-like enzyme
VRAAESRSVAAVLAAVAVALLLQIEAEARTGAPVQNGRPNVVLITTDDQTLESLRVMTNVQRLLVAEGATFTNSFATFPLCCPARATWLTGQYSHNHGVVGNHWVTGLKRLDQANTLPVWLQRAGYATIFVGKYLNGYGQVAARSVPPGWDEWSAGVRLTYLNHTMNRQGAIVRFGGAPEDYQTDVYSRLAIEAIGRRAADPSRPFFLWLSFFAPHAGSPRDADDPAGLPTPSPAPRHAGAFRSEPLPRLPSFNEADVGDKPAGIRKLFPLGGPDAEALQEAYQQRLESLLAVDEAVAGVVAELRRRGALGRTLVLFTSDNGFFHGEHRVRTGKTLLYEPSVRVPFVVRGPGVPRGLRLEQPVANVDLAPTIVAAAGATAERTPDGLSLLPLFADPGLEWGRDILLERGPGTVSLGERVTTAVRTPRFVYAEHLNGERELYDLAVDPNELQSLHLDPGYDAAEAELSRRLALLRNCAGPACSRGPELALAFAGGDGCARVAAVQGADERATDYVDFAVADRGVARDEDAPFELQLPGLAPPGAPAKLRAVAVLSDGRRVTLDSSVVPCA